MNVSIVVFCSQPNIQIELQSCGVYLKIECGMCGLDSERALLATAKKDLL
jgi:hypothetical protein